MRRLAYIALASALLASSSLAGSQKPSGAETGLLGVHLYDSGVKVITMFGSPNNVEGVTIGESSGGGGGAGGGGAIGAPGGAPGAPGAGHPGPTPGSAFDGFGNSLLQGASGATIKPHAKSGPPQAGGAESHIGAAGLSSNSSSVGPATGPSNSNASSQGNGQEVKFTRWIYNRSGCKYGFVLDNFNRVVQIEAIGMGNPKVHTARGIRFGSTFGQIMKRYNTKNAEGGMNAPDGYEVSGDSVTIRYLVKNKVAFRLNRLAKDGPQVVTAIAVSAGKQ